MSKTGPLKSVLLILSGIVVSGSSCPGDVNTTNPGVTGSLSLLYGTALSPSKTFQSGRVTNVRYFGPEWATSKKTIWDGAFGPIAKPVTANEVIVQDGPELPGESIGEESAAESLTGGQVLFTGGYADGEDFPTALAYLFDKPASPIIALPNMTEARRGHRMTRLADSTVLITGGFTGEIPNTSELKSAERFDSMSRTFKAVGAMNAARASHAAALLPDGRVLVVAGDSYEPDPNRAPTAELFDPVTETFTMSTGSPGNEWEHAVTLKNGKVLLTGANSTKAAVLYDPAIDSFVPTGSMTSEHGNSATATLLDDGRVLFAGGWDDNGMKTARTDIYDPATETFTQGPTMNNSRYGHIAFKTPDGNVLIAGGVSNEGEYLDRFEIFDPDSNTFTLQNSRMSSGFAFGSGAALLP